MNRRGKQKKGIDKKEMRSFGLLLGGVFSLIGIWPLLFRGQPIRGWALIAAAMFTLPAVAFPTLLAPVHRIWMAVGHILGTINTRIILSVVFYGMFTPVGLVMRLYGRDTMALRFDPSVQSYRIRKEKRASSHLETSF